VGYGGGEWWPVGVRKACLYGRDGRLVVVRHFAADSAWGRLYLRWFLSLVGDRAIHGERKYEVSGDGSGLHWKHEGDRIEDGVWSAIVEQETHGLQESEAT
jgi:hypothetical protein